MILWLLIALAIIAVDFIVKRITMGCLSPVGTSAEVIPGFFRFTYVQNKGAAFGMLSDARWVFMIISAVTIAAMVFFFLKFKPKNKLLCTAVTMICAGGIGNMIDRIFYGYVVDMIDFYGIWPYVFNVADSFVCIGAGLLILWLILDTVKQEKLKKAQTAAAAETAEADDPEENKNTADDPESDAPDEITEDKNGDGEGDSDV